MSDSSVPSIQFTSTGPVIPDAAAVLAGVQADMNAAFGGGLDAALETPQGQLASSTAAIVNDKNSDIATLCGNIDPDTAAGRWQDAIARIYYIDRLSAESTVVGVLCTGSVGTVIPVGAQCIDTSKNIYSCLGAGTIPSGGSITLQFANLQTGPIACPSGTINKPYLTIAGWNTVTNVSDGILGRDVESRADFEFRRKNSVAINGNGSVQAVYANVLNVAGVTDAYAVDNPTSAPVTIGGVLLAANSIYVAAVGGLNTDIADAIWRKKSQGCSMNGDTSVVVQDKEGYAPPYPSYTIKFKRPAALPILYAVQIANDANLPGNIAQLIKDAIVNAFIGGDNGPRARVGSTIYASRYIAPVAATSPYVNVLSLQIGTVTPNQSSLTINIDKVPTIAAANISVTLV